MDQQRLQKIEQYILSLFRRREITRLLAKEIFESTNEFANGDLVRAFEDLEKKWRLLVRHTNEGNDWVSLTPKGAEVAGIKYLAVIGQATALPHPPKSAI